MSGKPAWLASQIEDRTRTTDLLSAAADQVNVCRSIAADLGAQGQEHHSNPFWQAAVRESHRLAKVAEDAGIDVHDIGEEAARRR